MAVVRSRLLAHVVSFALALSSNLPCDSRAGLLAHTSPLGRESAEQHRSPDQYMLTLLSWRARHEPSTHGAHPAVAAMLLQPEFVCIQPVALPTGGGGGCQVNPSVNPSALTMRLRGAGAATVEMSDEECDPGGRSPPLADSSAERGPSAKPVAANATKRGKVPKYQDKILFLGQLPYNISQAQIEALFVRRRIQVASNLRRTKYAVEGKLGSLRFNCILESRSGFMYAVPGSCVSGSKSFAGQCEDSLIS